MGTTVAPPHRLLLDIDNTALNLTAEQESLILDVLPSRASYMREFARGGYSVIGMDPCCKASKYGGRYAESQRRVVDRVEWLGIPLIAVRGCHNATSLWSWEALLVFLGGSQLKVSAETVRALVTKLNEASPEERLARAVTLAQHGGALLLAQLVGAGLQIGTGPDASLG